MSISSCKQNQLILHESITFSYMNYKKIQNMKFKHNLTRKVHVLEMKIKKKTIIKSK